MPIRLPLMVLAALASSFITTACAQSNSATALPVARAASADTVRVADPRMGRVRDALAAAERGDFDAASYGDLAGHPLYGWIEYASLRRNIDSLDAARAQDFLARRGGQASGEAFRELWLAATARREDWAGFLAAWQPSKANSLDTSLSLRCAQLEARHALGRADAQWDRDAVAAWKLAGAKSAPGACDAPFALLSERGALTPALRWERIDAAAAEGQAGVMRAAARGLPLADAAQVEQYASFIETVSERALSWPRTERSRRMASYGLARLAKSSPVTAEMQLDKYANALGFDAADRARVLYPIALWTVASYEPESARRLAAVPATAYDERLHEWRAREAMARSDWAGALAAIRAMPDKQRNDSRWQYFEARLSEKAGDAATAARLYREAAKKPEFHGFLAADRTNQPYALCPWMPPAPPAQRTAVARDGAVQRALMLYQMQRAGWAEREWNEALSRFDDTQRRLAVDVAQEYGWFDRAVFSLGKNNPDELRLYTLRFPLNHESAIRREAAANRLDPAWVAAEIRAESIFNPNARSGANAMGLMQVLPGTGATTAQRIGRPWGGAQSLYEPETNIALGTAYLRQLMDSYGEGRPYFTLAGYNAGPAPLNRWKSQRPAMESDFWIETISYKETRDYVARVLAFSVLYDWRLNGDALRLSDRMNGVLDGPRKRFACPLAAVDPPKPAPAAPAPKKRGRRG